MAELRIVDVTDPASFGLIPPCADPGFDHRTCDYWEEADRGSKAARPGWLEAPKPAAAPARPRNPFLDEAAEPVVNPFLPRSAAGAAGAAANPFLDADDDPLPDNPFAPQRAPKPTVGSDAPRKLVLLGRGLAVFGSYAKVLLADGVSVAYSQFGPLSAYPRAMRLRELYSQLPDSPLPAVITCIATTADTRRRGHALHLVEAVCDDLAGRGFAAVEAYPTRGADPDATSAATPEFWIRAGFSVAVDDERFPVVRRELG
jgi:ribosomal protein S18 acetylase RimI-like enzyme